MEAARRWMRREDWPTRVARMDVADRMKRCWSKADGEQRPVDHLRVANELLLSIEPWPPTRDQPDAFYEEFVKSSCGWLQGLCGRIFGEEDLIKGQFEVGVADKANPSWMWACSDPVTGPAVTAELVELLHPQGRLMQFLYHVSDPRHVAEDLRVGRGKLGRADDIASAKGRVPWCRYPFDMFPSDTKRDWVERWDRAFMGNPGSGRPEPQGEWVPKEVYSTHDGAIWCPESGQLPFTRMQLSAEEGMPGGYKITFVNVTPFAYLVLRLLNWLTVAAEHLGHEPPVPDPLSREHGPLDSMLHQVKKANRSVLSVWDFVQRVRGKVVLGFRSPVRRPDYRSKSCAEVFPGWAAVFDAFLGFFAPCPGQPLLLRAAPPRDGRTPLPETYCDTIDRFTDEKVQGLLGPGGYQHFASQFVTLAAEMLLRHTVDRSKTKGSPGPWNEVTPVGVLVNPVKLLPKGGMEAVRVCCSIVLQPATAVTRALQWQTYLRTQHAAHFAPRVQHCMPSATSLLLPESVWQTWFGWATRFLATTYGLAHGADGVATQVQADVFPTCDALALHAALLCPYVADAVTVPHRTAPARDEWLLTAGEEVVHGICRQGFGALLRCGSESSGHLRRPAEAALFLSDLRRAVAGISIADLPPHLVAAVEVLQGPATSAVSLDGTISDVFEPLTRLRAVGGCCAELLPWTTGSDAAALLRCADRLFAGGPFLADWEHDWMQSAGRPAGILAVTGVRGRLQRTLAGAYPPIAAAVSRLRPRRHSARPRRHHPLAFCWQWLLSWSPLPSHRARSRLGAPAGSMRPRPWAFQHSPHGVEGSCAALVADAVSEGAAGPRAPPAGGWAPAHRRSASPQRPSVMTEEQFAELGHWVPFVRATWEARVVLPTMLCSAITSGILGSDVASPHRLTVLLRLLSALADSDAQLLLAEAEASLLQDAALHSHVPLPTATQLPLFLGEPSRRLRRYGGSKGQRVQAAYRDMVQAIASLHRLHAENSAGGTDSDVFQACLDRLRTLRGVDDDDTVCVPSPQHVRVAAAARAPTGDTDIGQDAVDRDGLYDERFRLTERGRQKMLCGHLLPAPWDVRSREASADVQRRTPWTSRRPTRVRPYDDPAHCYEISCVLAAVRCADAVLHRALDYVNLYGGSDLTPILPANLTAAMVRSGLPPQMPSVFTAEWRAGGAEVSAGLQEGLEQLLKQQSLRPPADTPPHFVVGGAKVSSDMKSVQLPGCKWVALTRHMPHPWTLRPLASHTAAVGGAAVVVIARAVVGLHVLLWWPLLLLVRVAAALACLVVVLAARGRATVLVAAEPI